MRRVQREISSILDKTRDVMKSLKQAQDGLKEAKVGATLTEADVPSDTRVNSSVTGAIAVGGRRRKTRKGSRKGRK